MSEVKQEPVTIGDDGKVVGKRGAKAYKKWIPKEWKPEYEAIVALSCTGLDNETVGRRFGYGKQQVSNILNTPQGKRLKEIIAARLRESNIHTLEGRLEIIAEAAIKNIEAALTDEVLREKAKLQLFDKSLAILKSIGKVKSDTPVSAASPAIIGHAQNVMVLSNEASKQLTEGLKKADEVKEAYADFKPKLVAS